MALEYAADLRIFDAQTAEDADPLQLIDAVAAWAEVGDPLREGDHEARRGHGANVSVIRDDDSELAGWRLMLAHPDDSDSGVTWTVTCTVTVDSGTHFALRLDRSRDGALRPLNTSPAPPRVLADLLKHEGLFAMDATFDVQATHYQVTPERVEGFARFLLDPQRRLPVIGLSARDDDIFDAGKFVRDNVGVAHVALVLPDSTWSLSSLLPDGIGVYGGAARLWWPGLTTDSVRWDHPLWTGDREARVIRRQVADQIRAVASSAAAEDVRWARLARERRARELDTFRAEAVRLSERLAAESPESGAPADWAEVEQIRRAAAEQFAAATALVEDAALEIEAERDRAKTEKLRADSAQALTRQLEAERDFYKHSLERIGGNREQDDLSEDERAIRREISAQLREASLDEARLYRFGPQFFGSLESLGSRYWDKAVRTCAAVVSGLPERLRSVDDHVLRTGEGGSDPQRMRASDGAGARRAALEQGAPSARRLHYWALGDGIVEFASVNLHDDLQIPEAPMPLSASRRG
jgi:hypothetical protein